MSADWLLALPDIAAIVAIAWAGGIAAQRVCQPRVAGEMAAIFLVVLLLGGWKPAGVAQSAFVLALAAALGANGLPIVARILEDRAT